MQAGLCKLLIAILLTLGDPAASSADDVQRFWQQTREQLDEVPADPQVEALQEPVPFRVWRITLRGLNQVRFRCLLALPVHGEGPAPRWPIIISSPGYGGKQQAVMLSECQRGYAVLQVFPRGQGESGVLSEWSGDKLTAKLDQPAGAYYQGAFADLMRAIDYVCTRDDLDSSRLALVGTSQGGGLSLAVASLDHRVTAVVAHVPFLCAMPLAAEIQGSLVNRLLTKANRNDAAALATLRYFDPLLLCGWLRAPVLMSSGGKDTLCPSATIEAVARQIPEGQRILKHYSELTHTSCVDFYQETWRWLDSQLRKPE
ncbi:acetylxylan esterase [Planctomicrobium sp. SH664]|uniref:acetylxylan esterase n=1 Tax=Planctomicrobium sp. SH664 TaxID=3448125 RepID=UPI003F5C1DBF